MLGDNIKIFRKNKGLTQEQLAVELNVVRQTVSKWEKNLSVPDAETLTRLADILDVSVSNLLGTPPTAEKEDLNDIATQLQNLNDLIAKQANHQKGLMHNIKILAGVIIFLLIVGAIYPKWGEIWKDFGHNLYYFLNG